MSLSEQDLALYARAASPKKVALEEDRKRGREGSLMELVHLVWHILEPGKPLIVGWHMEAICQHLEAVTRGEIRELLINVPPACSKSILTSVCWPLWMWLRDSTLRFINVSYGDSVVHDMAQKRLKVLQSEYFKERWPELIIPTKVAAGYVPTMEGGWIYCTTVSGQMTGKHCDYMIIDDPLKPADVGIVEGSALKTCERWWHETVPTRFRDASKSKLVCIMQRLHEDDLAGIMIREKNAQLLRIPMRFEPNHRCLTSIGWEDPRTVDGELMDPVRLPLEEVNKREEKLLARGTAAQHQQRPAPEAGAIFMREWLKYYKVMPDRFDSLTMSADCAFKDTDGSDYVAIQVWGVKGQFFYLVDQDHGHYDFPATCEAIRKMSRKWPKCVMKLIEDKANGTAVIQTLRKEIPGIVEIEPEGGKLSRASAVTGHFAAGNVWLPDPTLCPWVDGFVHELLTFPFASHDDRVDSCTQALNWLHSKMSNYSAAMKTAKDMFNL